MGRLAGATLAGTLTLGLVAVVGGTPVAGAAPTYSPCTAAGLVSDMASASGTTTPVTIALDTAGCLADYVINSTTPGVTGTNAFAPILSNEAVTIEGNGATISMGTGVTGRFFDVAAGGSLALDRVTLSGGSAGSTYGGGAVWNAGSLTVTSSTLANDTASFVGGAIESAGAGAAATVTGSTFTNDTVSGPQSFFPSGGAIDNATGGSLTVRQSSFVDDVVVASGAGTEAFGGAISDGQSGSGTLSVFASTFSGDEAQGAKGGMGYGGAINVGGGDGGSGTLSVTVSTFDGNGATTSGGAIGASSAQGSVVASTIAGSTTGAGGGAIDTSNALTLAADLIAPPSSGTAPLACETANLSIPPGGAPIDGGYNLVYDSSCGFGTGNHSRSGLGSSLAADLAPLASNGGPTETMALVGGSDLAIGYLQGTIVNPAPSAGYPQLCSRSDQRGIASSGNVCAVGAYEPHATQGVPGTSAPPPTLVVSGPKLTTPYGTAPPALTPSYSGFVNGDTVASLSSPATCTTTATASSPVGTYPITCSGAADPNYSIMYLPGAVTVTPAPLTVAGPKVDPGYGTPPPARFTPSYSGFVNGDTVASLGSPATCTTTATASSPVGTYPITCSGAADPNYTFTYVPGSFAITPAPLTVFAPFRRVVYGRAVPGSAELRPSYVGFVGTDSPASLTAPARCRTAARTGSPVRRYPITCSGAVDANYTIRYERGALDVVPAHLLVQAPSSHVAYGSPPPSSLPPTYTGFVGHDDPASLAHQATCTTRAHAGSAVGTHPITCSGATDPNYAIHYVPGTLRVTTVPLVVTAPSLKLAHGRPAPTPLSPSYKGFVNGDTARSLTRKPRCTTPVTRTSAAGHYRVTCAGAADANYAIRYVPGTITVAAQIPKAVIAGSAGLASPGRGGGLPVGPLALVALGALGAVLALVGRRRRPARR